MHRLYMHQNYYESNAQHGHANKNKFGVESSPEIRTDFGNISDNKQGLRICYTNGSLCTIQSSK